MESTKYWLQWLFGLSPMMIVIAVVGSLLAAFTLSIYGFFRVINVIWDVVANHELSEHQEEALSIELIELIDVFLISVILLIVALGLYQLFIDHTQRFPPALRVRSLDELKHKIVGVLCVILGVNFVSNAAEWSGGKDILYLGAAVALVLVALVFLLRSVDSAIAEEIHLQRDEAAHASSRTTESVE